MITIIARLFFNSSIFQGTIAQEPPYYTSPLSSLTLKTSVAEVKEYLDSGNINNTLEYLKVMPAGGLHLPLAIRQNTSLVTIKLQNYR